MSASAEARLISTRTAVGTSRERLAKAQSDYRRDAVEFIDEALEQSWTWQRIGAALGVSATGARRYYERNRRSVRGVTSPLSTGRL